MKAFTTLAVSLTIALFTSFAANACEGINCPLYVHVSLPEQLMYVYQNGQPIVAYPISSGRDGYDTRSYSGHPDGNRIMEAYTSNKFPGGNYVDPQGRSLGNMPYAMFFYGGYAIHGTPSSNWINIGSEASHGCIRMYPDQAYVLNRMVRRLGADNVWFFIDRNRVGTK